MSNFRDILMDSNYSFFVNNFQVFWIKNDLFSHVFKVNNISKHVRIRRGKEPRKNHPDQYRG